MNFLKKATSLLICAAMLFTLAACGGAEEPSSSTPSTNKKPSGQLLGGDEVFSGVWDGVIAEGVARGGGGAGIGEMLMQSHEGCIDLLPALPEKLSKGKFTGFRARGGYTVDAEWKDCKVVSFAVCADRDGEVKVELPAANGTPVLVG